MEVGADFLIRQPAAPPGLDGLDSRLNVDFVFGFGAGLKHARPPKECGRTRQEGRTRIRPLRESGCHNQTGRRNC